MLRACCRAVHDARHRTKKKNEAHGAMAMEVLITSNSMQQASPYCLVQVFGANKQLESVDWVIHGVKVGSYWPASFLKTLPGLHDLDENLLQGKRIRLHNNGKFVVSDVAAAVLFENPKNASQWANYDKHRSMAPSLTSIESGHINVSLLRVGFNFEFCHFVPSMSPRACPRA